MKSLYTGWPNFKNIIAPKKVLIMQSYLKIWDPLLILQWCSVRIGKKNVKLFSKERKSKHHSIVIVNYLYFSKLYHDACLLSTPTHTHTILTPTHICVHQHAHDYALKHTLTDTQCDGLYWSSEHINFHPFFGYTYFGNFRRHSCARNAGKCGMGRG